MKISHKIILTIVLVVIIFAVVNTFFYFWLKSSPLIEIAEKTIHNDRQLTNDIGGVQSVSPLFLSSKKFSWTGRRTKVQFDVFVDGNIRNCIMKFIMEKKENGWEVKSRVLKKCYDSGY